MKSGVHCQKISQTTTTDLNSQTVSFNMPSEPSMIDETKQETEKKGLGLSKMAVETIAGTIAGIAATIVSHPLDTVKIRFQVS